MHDWLSSAAMQQDYVLFLTFLAWAGAGALWWRFARTVAAWAWLPWSAGAGMAAAALELFNFILPVRPVLGVPPYLVADRIHGCLTAALLAGWFSFGDGWRSAGRRLRITTAICIAGMAALRWTEPASGGWALAIIATLHLAFRPTLPRSMCVLAVWISCHGPLAEAAAQSRRWTETSEWGLLWSTAQFAAASVALLSLARRHVRPTLREDERLLVTACGVWLAAGLGLAAWMGGLARRNFEAAALSRVETAAALMDQQIVTEALGERFQLRGIFEFKQPSGRTTLHGRVPLLADRVGLQLRSELGKIERANQDVSFVYASVLRDGWIVTVTSDRQRRSTPEGVGLSSRAEERHRKDWESQTARFLRPYQTSFGPKTTAQAPLARNGRMFGWLMFDFPSAAWSASQGQARLLVFVIVTLGLGLAVLMALQRRQVREREEARAAASAAAAADQLKTAFLAKVSHELRTPIQSILGYSELLRAVVPDATGRTRLAALRQHGELMLRLVNDLLDLSAIQVGAFRLNERPTALVDLVHQTTESLRARAEAKHLELACRIDPAVPEWVFIDGERVRQIVLNLVGNAIKFTDAGRVDVKLSPGPAPVAVCLTVADTGPGIAPAERARLFQPFFRLEATAAKEGTGLGLSLAAALCRSMQGSISVDGNVSGGACFTATFRATPCLPLESSPAALRRTLPGRKVLVAEDNALVRELFTAFLQDEGANCVAVGDGEAALAAAERESFDAVILDLGMPRLDGVETARRLRLRAAEGLRIIGVSAHAAEHEKARALAAGMDAFLTKPVELSTLAAALDAQGSRPAAIARPEVMARLMAQFRSEAAVQRAAIATALRDGDRPALFAAAHYLKNSAAIVRDDPLYNACCALERAATGDDSAAARVAWEQCEAALQAWLRSDLPAGESSPALQPNRQSSPHHG
jgi:signal transduction histidine kinase/DNA-binding NarL/FixJ family response regulator